MTGRSGDLKLLRAKAGDYLEELGRKENIFQLTPGESVFLAVDMQNFVCDPAPGRELPNIKGVMERINQVADFCHGHAIPVVWIRQCFTQKAGGDDVGLYRLFHKEPLDPGMFSQGESAELHPGMHVDHGKDFIVEKNRYSAFSPGSSRLEPLLSGLGRRQLILGGAATNVCVESTARDAMQHGYQVTVLTDATTAFDELIHQVSLMNLKLFFGDTRPMEEVLLELANAQSSRA